MNWEELYPKAYIAITSSLAYDCRYEIDFLIVDTKLASCKVCLIEDVGLYSISTGRWH